MRKIHIDKVTDGTKLAKAIFSPDGKILLASGAELRESLIEKLRAFSIFEVYIEDDISKGIDIQDVICERTRIEAKTLVKNIMNNYEFSNFINIEEVKDVVGRIIDKLLSNDDILANLYNIKSVDDYTFEHSVNVCILSLLIGMGLGYNTVRLKDLGIGALLHDIGKLRIPEEILKKPSQLTVEEFEEIKKHTIYGYEILKANKNVSMASAFIAFGHHERIDGSGYPLQLKDDNIHFYAKIVAVADVFDALTSDRVYRNKLLPHEVFEYITSLGFKQFDQQAMNSFIKYVSIYPVGSGVILSTRERGIVIKQYKTMPTRPVVRIIYSKNDEKLKNFFEVDLTKTLNVCIVRSCEI